MGGSTRKSQEGIQKSQQIYPSPKGGHSKSQFVVDVARGEGPFKKQKNPLIPLGLNKPIAQTVPEQSNSQQSKLPDQEIKQATIQLPSTTVPATNAMPSISSFQMQPALEENKTVSILNQPSIDSTQTAAIKPISAAAAMQANQISSGANQFTAPSLNGITFGGS